MNQENNQNGVEIDILKLAEAVLKRWWVILLSGLLAAAIFLGYTIAFVTPQYQSNVLFYVNNSSMSIGSQSISISTGELSAAKTLVDTYCVILKTRHTLDDVSASLKNVGLNYSYSQLNSMITYGTVNDTEIFRVVVTCSDPADACTIANTLAQILPEKISKVVDGSSVRVVDNAVVAAGRTSPSYSKNTLIGFAVGVVLAIAALAVLYIFNDTITSEEWLLNTYKEKIPLLATIPDANGSGGSRYGRYNKYGKYKYKYGYRYGYGYGYGRSRGYYGNYRYGYRNGYYGSKPSSIPKAAEPTQRIDTL